MLDLGVDIGVGIGMARVHPRGDSNRIRRDGMNLCKR